MDDVRFERTIALLHVLGGLVVAGYAISMGGVGMWIFAGVALVAFGALGRRAWRRADRVARTAQEPPTPFTASNRSAPSDPPTLPDTSEDPSGPPSGSAS